MLRFLFVKIMFDIDCICLVVLKIQYATIQMMWQFKWNRFGMLGLSKSHTSPNELPAIIYERCKTEQFS